MLLLLWQPSSPLKGCREKFSKDQLDLHGPKIQEGLLGAPQQPIPTMTTPTDFRVTNTKAG